MKCFACDAQIRDEARFCPYCGKDQSQRPAQQPCLHCGEPLVPGADFCGNCGGDQSQVQETVSEQMTATEKETVVIAETETTEQPEETQETEAVEEVVPEETASEEAEPMEEKPVLEEVSAAPAAELEPEKVVPVAQPVPEPVVNPVSVPVQTAMPVAQPVVQPVYAAPVMRPAFQLPVHRGMWKMILLGLITMGIYPAVIMCKMSMEINVVASRYDGKWTMHYLCMAMLAPLTLMIYPFVWIHGLCERMGDELIRRKVNYKFSAATFWLWNLLYPILGSVITALLVFLLPMAGLKEMVVYASAAAAAVISVVGPFVYLHKHMKAMNLLNADYNEKG